MNPFTSILMVLVAIPVMLGFFVNYGSDLARGYFKSQLKSFTQQQNDLAEYQAKLKDKPAQQGNYGKADGEVMLIAKRDNPSNFRGSFAQLASNHRIQLTNQVAGDPVKPCVLGSRWSMTPFTVDFTADSASTSRFINEILAKHTLVRLVALKAVSNPERPSNVVWNAKFEIAYF